MGTTTLTATEGDRVCAVTRSFEDFYRETRDDIARALVLTTGSRELGIEAADEAMTRALQRWDKVGTYDNPSGWVFRVGLNWARSTWRKRRREVQDIYTQPAVDDQPIDVDLEKALAELDDRFRAVVVLRFFLDWSIAQTADALSVKPGTVKSRLSRALDRLGVDMRVGDQ